MSIFEGRQKKRQRPKNDVPFWEKSGSFKSLFFGRFTDTEGIVNVSLFNFIDIFFCTMFIPVLTICFVFSAHINKQNGFDNEGSNLNTCTRLFKTTFMSSIATLSYICRWASCRGALPQPIIVFILAASALSAPRRKEFLLLESP